MAKRGRAAGRRKDIPLRVRLHFDVLTIEIGIDTLRCATLHSPGVYEMAGDVHDKREVARRFSLDNPDGFASDVKRALLDEREDGSSLLTDLLDKATQAAIEDGSEHFIDKDYPP